ncbi:MAG: polysaccharide deacetylase family protein [Oscillospiraceae bacterium]|nr:polysaccharide deacetylase family protein [Oscillospiraceae bacterium]
MRYRKLLGFFICIALMLNCGMCIKKAYAENNRLPIFMYHNITEKSDKVSAYTVSVKNLENDLVYLKENGYETITMTDLFNHLDYGASLPKKPVMLTFDDGFESVYVYALPLLEKYNMKAVVAIVGSYTDQYTETADHHLDYSYLSWPQVEKMQQSGRFEVQNHTNNFHNNKGVRQGCRINPGETTSDYKAAFTKDINALQDSIEAHIGWRPNTFVYPYGFYCKESDPILSDMGFRAGLSCQEIVNQIPQDGEHFFLLGRFNRSGKLSTQEFCKKALGLAG